MKKIILIGAVGSGKTTFMQALKNLSMKYKKTQSMEYHGNVIDTPGEYLENRRFYNALIVASYDCDMILLIQDGGSKRCVFPPKFASMFGKPVFGVITKIDKEIKDIDYAKKCLNLAGADIVFEISALMGLGLEELAKYIK